MKTDKSEELILNEARKKHKHSESEKIVELDSGQLSDEEMIKIMSKNEGKKGRKAWKPILGVLLAIIVVFLVYNFLNRGTSIDSESDITTYIVEEMDITATLDESGTLEAANSYEVTALVTGEILVTPISEGDIIEKDTLLYEVDSSSVANNIEKSEIALEQSRHNYSKLIRNKEELLVTSSHEGHVSEIYIEVGDDINIGDEIATVRDDQTMVLVLPFSYDDAKQIAIGETATVTIDGTYESLNGTVSEVSKVDQVKDGNMIVRNVTIEVENPGGITESHSATANIGDYYCNDDGMFSYKSETSIIAKMAGEVVTIYINEGDSVSKGSQIAALSSDTVSDNIKDGAYSLRNAEISLESQYDILDNYSINSPISGTIIEKNVKLGDTLLENQVLCTILDLSYLTVTLDIDELDISKINIGQEVTINAEAIEDKTYTGEITKININGVSSSGVTTYPVTIQIDETEGLLPGMNIDAEITVASVTSVVAVPTSAVVRNNQILIKSESVDVETNQVPNGSIPEGYEYIQVVTGVSNDDYIQIVEGLEVGDTIYIMEDMTMQSVDMSGGFGGGQQQDMNRNGGPGGF